jgi:hypothetical protein
VQINRGQLAHESHDVLVLTDGSIYQLPEVYVSDGAIRWREGGRLPKGSSVSSLQLASVLRALAMHDTVCLFAKN